MCSRKRSSDIEQLTEIWYKKLKDSGFVDIEDSRQNLKNQSKRTIKYRHQDLIREFFLKLDDYIRENFYSLPPIQRDILELYSYGTPIIQIAKSVNKSRSRVHRVIKHHKEIIKKLLIN